jgi:DMSO reductase anchor subunit
MWRELTTLWQSIRDPEYAHLLLDAVPLYGVAAGLLFLIVAYAGGEKKTRLLALAVISLSCASVWPYLDLRTRATPRILATRDPAYGPLIQQQTRLRHETAWIFYAMAGTSALTLLLSFTKFGKYLMLITVVGGAVVFWISIWLHKKECEIYHRNIIRYVPPRQ